MRRLAVRRWKKAVAAQKACKELEKDQTGGLHKDNHSFEQDDRRVTGDENDEPDHFVVEFHVRSHRS